MYSRPMSQVLEDLILHGNIPDEKGSPNKLDHVRPRVELAEVDTFLADLDKINLKLKAEH